MTHLVKLCITARQRHCWPSPRLVWLGSFFKAPFFGRPTLFGVVLSYVALPAPISATAIDIVKLTSDFLCHFGIFITSQYLLYKSQLLTLAMSTKCRKILHGIR